MIDEAVIETLRDAQRFGFFGVRPIDEAVEHSMGFVRAIGSAGPGTSIIDLGSGGGLPGLVLAAAFPDAEVTLLDRRQKRTDFLHRAVTRLGWTHVSVLTCDATDLVRDVASGVVAAFEVVTARGFGPPTSTIRIAASLLVDGGHAVISEPPTGDRWDAEVLAGLGLEGSRLGNVSVFRRVPRET